MKKQPLFSEASRPRQRLLSRYPARKNGATVRDASETVIHTELKIAVAKDYPTVENRSSADRALKKAMVDGDVDLWR